MQTLLVEFPVKFTELFQPVGFLLSPAIGAIVMSLSTVIVAGNAQLMRRTEL